VVICITILHFTEYQSGRCSEIFIRNRWNEWRSSVWADTQNCMTWRSCGINYEHLRLCRVLWELRQID